MNILARYVLMIGASALFAGCGGSSIAIGRLQNSARDAHSPTGAKTFHYTGAEQKFVVPNGVTRLTVVARGGAGGGYPGSRGGRVFAVIPVTSGETLAIFVGGAGSWPRGGFNGGAKGGKSRYCRDCPGYGGGGASDVREGGDSLNHRILVVGGGGGQGGFNAAGYGVGGKGGGTIGGSGTGCSPECNFSPGGGSGGTQYGGGLGGKGGEGGSNPGGSGHGASLANGGVGGAGGSGLLTSGGGGGGGGGGYYGGGGGGGGGAFYSDPGPAAGGGGGSSYIEPQASRFRNWQGWKNATGDGLVVFSWE